MTTAERTQPPVEVPVGFFRPRALATHLGVTERTVYKWIERDRLDIRRVGRNIFITAESVERLLSQDDQ
jgi:excisionase family DNA binding protein